MLLPVPGCSLNVVDEQFVPSTGSVVVPRVQNVVLEARGPECARALAIDDFEIWEDARSDLCGRPEVDGRTAVRSADRE